MRKRGILNAELNAAISRLGHTDVVVVVDCGTPAPAGVPVVDLAVVQGVPGFVPVLDALLAELVVERAVAATEVAGQPAEEWLSERFPDLERIPHEDFKAAQAHAKLIVRTGEATPYANVALTCGVPF